MQDYITYLFDSGLIFISILAAGLIASFTWQKNAIKIKRMDEIIKKLEEMRKSGEPIFIIRAKDIFASDTVLFWAGQMEMTKGPNDPKVIAAKNMAANMEQWQKANADKINIPG